MPIRSALALAALLIIPVAAPAAQESATVRAAPLRPATPRSLRQGRGAIVTSRVAIDGRPVGRMERTPPMNQFDSGWAFYSGDEEPGALIDVHRIGIYDLDVIAAHDPAIRAYLDAPVGSDLIREGDRFVPRPRPPSSN